MIPTPAVAADMRDLVAAYDAGESAGTPSYSGGDYYPIERVAAFPFDELPEKLDEDELTGRSR